MGKYEKYILTIMGLIPQINTTVSIFARFGHDIWLHRLDGVIALFLVLVVKPVPASALAKAAP